MVFLQFHPRYRFKTGLSIGYYQLNYDDYSILWGCDFTGTVVDPSNSWLDLNRQLTTLGTQIEFQYFLAPTAKVKLYPILGGSYQIILQSSYEGLNYECGQSSFVFDSFDDIHDPTEHQFLVQFGVGISVAEDRFYLELIHQRSLTDALQEISLIGGTGILTQHRLQGSGIRIGTRF